MKKVKFIPFGILVSLFAAHNLVFADSLIAAEIIYLAYFLLVVIGCTVTLVRSCIYGNEFSGKHTVSRFWASNAISVALLLFLGFHALQFSSDVVRSRVVDGVFEVQSNLNNIAGAFVLQQPNVRDPEQNVVSLMFLGRAQYLRVGEKYHLRYAERSGYILTAEKFKEPNR